MAKFGIINSVRTKGEQVRVCTPDLLRAAVDSARTSSVCAEIADRREQLLRGELTAEEYKEAKNRLKLRLHAITPHATFEQGKRDNALALPSGLCMYDADHIPNPRGYWEEKQQLLREKHPEVLEGIVWVHVTPSLEGVRIIFRLPQGKSLPEAQKWLSEMLEDEAYDGSTKDLARCSFLVPRSYFLLFREEELFAECEAPTREQLEEIEKKVGSDSRTIGQLTMDTIPAARPATYCGIPYSAIIDGYFRQKGIALPVQEGDRNNQLFHLTHHLRALTDNNAQLILSLLPRFGLTDEEVQGIVQSAFKKPFIPMTLTMKRVVASLNEERKMKNEGFPEKTGWGNGDSSLFTLHSSLIPKLPKRLPRLIKHLISLTPDAYKEPLAHAVFPSLATHLRGVQFRYIDNVLHEPTLMNILMAPTGAGKSCINKPIGYIMADIKERDRISLQKEQQWKDEMNSKGANKDKRKRPEGLVVQMINPDITNAAFVLRLHEAQGHFLYTQMNELEMLNSLRGNGRDGQQFQIICLAFDQDNTYGQTRVGTQSVTHSVTVRFNWNACTTIKKGKHYFRNVLVDGPLSRINFCTIPEQEIGAEIPVYGTYDEHYAEVLKPYIDHLNEANGLIDCPQAHRLALELREECAEFARLSESRVYENFSFRALVIAWLKACILYVANGCKWEAAIGDFVRWSLQYDLWCKMEFFGEAVERAMHEETSPDPHRGMRNMLELLPNVFTLQQLTGLRLQEGKDASPAKTQDQLRKWAERGYIVAVKQESDKYRKLKYLRDDL